MRLAGPAARGPLWAITTYYAFDDPPGRRRRLGVYREFRRRLAAPLLTVELSRNGEFHLESSDADQIVRVQGGALLWQKERLLNLAVEALPADCEAVAWIDGDILFSRDDWVGDALEALGDFPLVHLFRRTHHLGPGAFEFQEPFIRTCDSTAHLRARGLLADEYFDCDTGLRGNYQCGIAWAARRELLDRCGLYDAMILGSGDKVMFYTACGRPEAAVQAYRMCATHEAHFRAWAEPFAAAVGGRIGVVDCETAHLWHGDLANRGYSDRYDGFEAFDFDPDHDMRLGAEGAWDWASEKPELHAHVARYFDRRRAG